MLRAFVLAPTYEMARAVARSKRILLQTQWRYVREPSDIRGRTKVPLYVYVYDRSARGGQWEALRLARAVGMEIIYVSEEEL